MIRLANSIDRVYPSEAIIVVNGTQAKALEDLLTTVSKLRLGNNMGTLTAGEVKNIGQLIKLQLGYVT